MKAIEVLEQICKRAEDYVFKASKGCKSINFKDNFCVKFFQDGTCRLVVYDTMAMIGKQMSYVWSSMSCKHIELRETFAWKARTEENEMLIEASLIDGSIHLPVLGSSNFKLPDAALKTVLNALLANGAIVKFDTHIVYEIEQQHAQKRLKLITNLHKAEAEFGRNSQQANVFRQQALQEITHQPDELDAGRIIVEMVPKPFSCIEEFEVFLDLNI